MDRAISLGRPRNGRPGSVLVWLGAAGALAAASITTSGPAAEPSVASVSTGGTIAMSPGEAEELSGGGVRSLTVSPASVRPCTSVQVVATGLAPGEEVRLGVGPVDSEYQIFDRAVADADGRVEVSIGVDAGAAPHQSWVIVIEGRRGRSLVSNPFAIEEPEGGVPPCLSV